MTPRRAEPADAPAIAEVHVGSWQAAYRHVFPAEVLAGLSADERAAGWRERLEDDMALWVVEAGERVVGFAAAGPSRTEPEAESSTRSTPCPKSGAQGRRLS